MKKALLAMLGMFLVLVWPCGGLWSMLLTPILGGGTEQSFLYPLYGGLILLPGLVVGCTDHLAKELRAAQNTLAASEKKEQKGE